MSVGALFVAMFINNLAHLEVPCYTFLQRKKVYGKGVMINGNIRNIYKVLNTPFKTAVGDWRQGHKPLTEHKTDFHLFPKFKRFHGGNWFDSDDMLKETGLTVR